MATGLTIAINNSNSDVAYQESGSVWYTITTSDYLVFSAGSSVVANGLAIPTQTQLNQAGVVLNGSQQIVPYYFLADTSASILRQIYLAGNVNAQHVFAFNFNGPTASEPVLELWDDSTFLTVASTTLGAGTPSNSWWRGITTTSAPSGSNWTGYTLAGASNTHYLQLNNGLGALSAAGTLYCNIQIVVPSSATTGTAANPVFVCKYASN